jgi:hypothetical protein
VKKPAHPLVIEVGRALVTGYVMPLLWKKNHVLKNYDDYAPFAKGGHSLVQNVSHEPAKKRQECKECTSKG